MKGILGIGEYGSCEAFGSTTVCVTHIPSTQAPAFTAKFLGYLNHTANDYDAFRVLKEVFPNYGSINMVDWLITSHYYDMPIDNDLFPGVINFLATDFDSETIPSQIVSHVYTVDVNHLNQMMDDSGSMGAVMYALISTAIERLSEDIGLDDGESDTEDPNDQFVASWLSNMIARAGYLSHMHHLEMQCEASLPRGVGKEANDFYLTRCVHMTPEDKKRLFKTYLMERRN